MSMMGLTITPKSKFSDVSGVRLEFPPNNPSPCVLQVAGVNGGVAEGGVAPAFTQSGFPDPMLPPVDAAREGGLYRLKSEGARKPVEAVPRKVTKLAGCHRAWIFGLLVIPKSLYQS